MSCFLRPINRQATLRRIEKLWSPDDDSLVCLSLRSGFDHVLKALDLPRGSEVLMSAISVRPMAKIIEHHGLVPVPVDVDIDTLAVRPEALRRVLSRDSKVLVIAQLFGNRNSQEQILEIARQHGLVTIEDGAQTFTGDSYHGDPGFDVSMVSFGPIKTASTVVGGILRFRDPALRDKVHNVQAEYPVHSRRDMLRRLFKFMS